mgnify:CR=1 FL=1
MMFVFIARCDRVKSDITLAVANAFINIHSANLMTNNMELAPNFAGIITSLSTIFGTTVGISGALILQISTVNVCYMKYI